MDNHPFVHMRLAVRLMVAAVWDGRAVGRAKGCRAAPRPAQPLDLSTHGGERYNRCTRSVPTLTPVRMSNACTQVQRLHEVRWQGALPKPTSRNPARRDELSPSVTNAARVGHAPHQQPVQHVWTTRPTPCLTGVPSVDNEPLNCEQQWTTASESTPRTGGHGSMHRPVCGVITYDRSGTSPGCPHCQHPLLRLRDL